MSQGDSIAAVSGFADACAAGFVPSPGGMVFNGLEAARESFRRAPAYSCRLCPAFIAMRLAACDAHRKVEKQPLSDSVIDNNSV
jgi:hypothetical protein